jgi:aryl-alcohol dehydrogenase-like predicted oxidoreductase
VNALDASMKRLKTDYIDLYQMHSFEPETPLVETMDTLAGFVRAGKVRYLGASNFLGSQIVEAQWAAERVRGAPLISLQPRYSLISREIESDVLPTARRQGLGCVTYSPLGFGVLSGKYRVGEQPPPDTRYGGGMGLRGTPELAAVARAALSDRALSIASTVTDVASTLGTEPAAVAVARCLGRKEVTSVIIGPRTVEHLDAYLPAFSLNLPSEMMERLSDASRAPPG